MNITDITKLAGAHRRRRRVGRGRATGRGKTCGRGHKGYGARAGATKESIGEGGQMPTFRRLPKRGFSNAKFRQDYHVVNVAELEERCEAGEHVTPQWLKEKGLIRNLRLPVKILGDGELSKKIRVDATKFSRTAREKIEKAGGEAKIA